MLWLKEDKGKEEKMIRIQETTLHNNKKDDGCMKIFYINCKYGGGRKKGLHKLMSR